MSRQLIKRNGLAIPRLATVVLLLALCISVAPSARAQGSRFTSDLSGNLLSKASGGLLAPQIQTQPQSQIVEPGRLASFSVVVVDSQGVTYQWRFNGNPISGATSDSLVLTNVSAGNEGQYSVVVTNSAGNATSANATLFIDSDRDGLADSWEQTNFGNLTQSATGDFDNDGVSNLDEFRDGTNPNSNASLRPRLTIITDGGGAVATSPTKVSYNLGEVVTLTAIANPPNTFHGWSGALTTQTNPETLTMSASKTVKAHFISTPIPAGVVSWWRAENNALDTIGNNNGALINGVSFATGEVGQAFNFTATTQQVKVNSSPTLNVGPGSGMTIEAWIKPTDLTERPIAEWNNGSASGWGAHFWSSTSFSGLGGPGCLYTNLKDINNVDHFVFSPAGLLSTTAWQHVAVTYDRTSGVGKLFLNGAVVATANWGSFVPNTTSDLYLGSRPGGNSYSGLMDEPALYNRALTVDEIFAINAGGPAGKTAAPYFTSPSQLPEAALGNSYSQQLVATLGAAPLTYSLGTSALPPGLSLSATGLISGTPTIAGTYFFSVRVTDAVGQSFEQIFSLKVSAPLTPPAGLTSWWRGENDAQDSFGTNHGTLQNGVTFTTGKVGQAFNFNGSNQCVLVPNSATLQPQTLSVDAWVYPRTVGTFNDSLGSVIFTKDRGSVSGAPVSYALLGPGNTGRFTANIQFTDSTTMNLQSTNTYAFNQWYHVAMTWSGDTLNLYVNGNLAASASTFVPKTIIYTNDSAAIGRHSFVARSSDSVIDEVTLTSRALAATEVAAIFNAGLAGKTTAGPIINTPSALPDGYVGQVYSQTMTALRTSGATTYSVTNGSLPPGLSLSSVGLLSGTPTTPGTYNFTVRLADASALIAEQVFTLAVYASPPPLPGLVSWWRAENNASDAIGANHGTLTNGTTFAPGRVGQAFALDGANDYVNIPDSPSLRPVSLTLEAWVLFTASNGVRVIIAKPFGAGTLDSYGVYLDNGVLKAFVGDAAGAGSVLQYPFSPVLGRWYHIAFTFNDATWQQVLFLDGVTVALGTGTKSPGYDTRPLVLGADIENGTPNYFHQGRIDEATIYSRALSTTEIASIFNSGSAGRTVTGPYFNTPWTLPEALVATPYSQKIATSRGTAPITITVVGGSLPPGLTLNSSGLLSGTPTTAGSFSFTVRATDANSLMADLTFTLPVLPKVSPPAGIISWWRGENNSQDSIAANHGTLTNGTTFTGGKVGTAFSFDGVDDLVSTPSINAGSKFSVEFWLFPTRSAGYEHLVSNSGGSTNYGDLYFKDNHIEYWQGNVLRAATVSGTIPLFSWSHIALTYDNGVDRIYINGVPLAVSGSHTETFNNALAFGYTNAASNNHLKGMLDEIAVYNRALGGAEIAALYSAGAAGKTTDGPYINTAPQLPDGTINQSYNQTITSLRGTGAVTYALLSGALPPGITLASNGVLSGTPTATGSFNFVVRATDSSSAFGDETLTLRIFSPFRIPTGLISWWKAENNALDAIGTNNGTLTNGTTFAAGKAGTAFSFDGIDDLVTTPSINAGSKFSVEFWLFPARSAAYEHLVSNSGGSSNYGDLYFKDDHIEYWQGGVQRASTAVGSVPLSTWSHIALTCDNGVDLVYINGVLFAVSVSHTETFNNPLVFGYTNAPSNNHFKGMLDEISLYNRAITAQEVNGIYNAGAASKRLFYPFETWKLTNLGNADAPIAGNPDGDGLSNLLEYAFNSDPNNPASSNQPIPSLDATYLSLTYTKVLGATDLTYSLQQSTDLTLWQSVTPTNVILSDNGTVQTIKAQVPRSNAGSANRLFLRVRVTLTN